MNYATLADNREKQPCQDVDGPFNQASLVTRAADRESPWRRKNSHGPEAIARLITLTRSDNEAVALRAAEAILDRAYGRPPQAVTVQEKRPLQIIICDAPPPESSRLARLPDGLPSLSRPTNMPKTVVIE